MQTCYIDKILDLPHFVSGIFGKERQRERASALEYVRSYCMIIVFINK